jgi:ribosomal protein L11 methyltransferase
MTRDWVDVVIATDLDAGELISRLDDPLLQGAWQDGSELHLYWPLDRWTAAQQARLQTMLQELAPGTASPAIQVQQVPDRDWNRLWAESVKPLRVGRRLVIRPSWESVELRPHEFEIVLDPKQAFGTGHHATTHMLLEWLQDDLHGGETVLDVGTGSGLLAMVALRLGAARAVGIDHDPVAIECARDYARQNRFGDELRLHCGELSREQSYDWVLANLDRHTLLLLADRLAGCTRTTLLISGLLEEQREEIVGAFALVGLYVGRQREREGWLALELNPVQSCEETTG